MSFILFAWISSFLYGGVAIIAKLFSKYSLKNQWLFNFLYSGSILLWTIPLALLNHAGWPSHVGNIILTGGFYALSGLLYIIAIYELDVSTIGPLYNFQTAFAVILAGILLQERLTNFQYILVGIIFFAGLFTAMDEKLKIRSFFRWPIIIAIGSTLSLGFGSVFIHKSLSENSYWTVTLWVPIISQILLLSTIPFFVKDVKKVTIKPLFSLLLLGIFDVFGLLTAYKAYSVNVALSAVIISLPISLLLAVLFSIFLPSLLEKHTLKVYAIRVTAAVIMVFAALKLSVG